MQSLSQLLPHLYLVFGGPGLFGTAVQERGVTKNIDRLGFPWDWVEKHSGLVRGEKNNRLLSVLVLEHSTGQPGWSQAWITFDFSMGS